MKMLEFNVAQAAQEDFLVGALVPYEIEGSECLLQVDQAIYILGEDAVTVKCEHRPSTGAYRTHECFRIAFGPRDDRAKCWVTVPITPTT